MLDLSFSRISMKQPPMATTARSSCFLVLGSSWRNVQRILCLTFSRITTCIECQLRLKHDTVRWVLASNDIAT